MNAGHLVHLKPFPTAGQISTAIMLRTSVNIINNLNIGPSDNAITRHLSVCQLYQG